MWNLLKKIFSLEPDDFSATDTNPSIQKLVSFNALNKRKNIRIKYPHFGAVGPFPHVYYMNHEMIVGNVSVGGIFILDDTEKFGDEVGEVVVLDVTWDDFTTKVRARVVGANLQKRHLQFVDFNAQAFLRISKLTKPGYLGSRFHKVHDTAGKLEAIELWVGPTSESLVFSRAHHFAELTINGQKIQINRGQPTVFTSTQQPISKELLSDIFVTVANFPQYSDRVKDLLEIIETELTSLTSRKVG